VTVSSNRARGSQSSFQVIVIGALAKYKIIKKLGAGGMGEVYKAEDPILQRTVAIKVISKQQAEHADAEERFLREARAASAINHPNIVTIYEIGETEDQTYIVMEYVEGRSLRELLLSGSLRADQITRIAVQICEALEEAHARGLIHRDVKPENILINDRGLVKVVDFGLAKVFRAGHSTSEREKSLTETGAVMGTLSYMSPEQLRGESLDARTDIFSFGILLHELITGRLPFDGETALEVAASILKENARRIGRLPVGLSPGLERIVSRSLEKNRNRRYQSFRQVREDIEGLSEVSFGTATTVELSPSAVPPFLMSDRLQVHTPTILVLPLETLPGDEYIGIGLAHAITTDLAKIAGLSVLSKTAGEGLFRKGGRSATEIARELGATIMLEGEVMRSGVTLGVMARLSDVETGRVIWGMQYRGDASDLFSIQDAVCESVADALKVSVSTEVREMLARPATTNIDSFEFYSKGRAFLERRDVKENIDYAVQMFEEALKLDQSFALAYAGLGEAYWQKYQATHEQSWVERAVVASDRALALDPRQAQVHVSLGIIYHGTGRTERAIEEFEGAVTLQPSCDEALKWLGQCYLRKGDKERAIGYFKKAIQIRPGYWDHYVQLGYCLYAFGSYEEASEQFRRVIAIQPDNYLGYNNLGGMYYLLGLFEESVAMHKKAIEIYPNQRSYSNLGTGYFYLERYDEAIEAYKSAVELDPRDGMCHMNLGDVYWRVGLVKEANEEFETSCALLNEQSAINPADGGLLGRLAVCQAKLKRRDQALKTIENAIALEPHDTTLMYLRAVVYALTGDSDTALSHLGLALSHGYSRSEAQRDPDLESLRNRPGYKTLFSEKRPASQS
jgi:serine/threonine protein kinase/tetratricopeptide (TPR) repeat protein